MTNLTLFFLVVLQSLRLVQIRKRRALRSVGELFIWYGFFCTLCIDHCQTQLPLEIIGIVEFVRMINVALGVINIFPLLVLDGGKIVLLFLSRFFVSFKKAVAFLAEITNVVALLIMAAGLFVSIKGYFQGGLWWILIGMYLQEGTALFQRKHQIREILKSYEKRSCLCAIWSFHYRFRTELSL